MKKRDANNGYWAQVATSDGLRLDGFLHSAACEDDQKEPVLPSRESPVPIAMLMHGAGANFYGASLVNRIGSHLLKDGWNVLRTNNRGHDGWHVAFRGGKMIYLGSAFERLEESVLDVAAWLDWLKRSGYGPVTLVGHSLGAFKSLFCLKTFSHSENYREHWEQIDRLVVVSPPSLTQTGFANSERQEEYLKTIQHCHEMIEADQDQSTFWATYPFPMLLSPGCYLNKYASGEDFAFLNWLETLDKPVYWIFGGAELETHDVLSTSVGKLQEHLPDRHQLDIVNGADHFFTGYTRQVCQMAVDWLRG